MSISEIEAAIEKLPPEDLARLAEWFADYLQSRWDERIADDLHEGRLDPVLREARAEYEQGKAREL